MDIDYVGEIYGHKHLNTFEQVVDHYNLVLHNTVSHGSFLVF